MVAPGGISGNNCLDLKSFMDGILYILCSPSISPYLKYASILPCLISSSISLALEAISGVNLIKAIASYDSPGQIQVSATKYVMEIVLGKIL